MQFLFDAEKLFRLFFLDRSDRNASPARNHVFDIFAGDYARRRFVEMIFLAQSAQVLALLALFIGVEARLLELVVRDGVLHPVNDELDPLLDLGDLLRQRSLAQLYAGAGFVDKVDRLVWQEAIRNITVGMQTRRSGRLRRCKSPHGTSRSVP